jgi:hypothetical protein
MRDFSGPLSLPLVVPYNQSCCTPKAKAQVQAILTAISMFEDSLQIVMDRGWFDMASLVAIARCNHQMYALVDRADHLWEPFLAEIKFPQTGLIDDTDWKSPDIPPLGDAVDDLRVPPRINGGIRDGSSFFVHPRDLEARGRGLVLAQNYESWRGKSIFNQTTGILKDLFHNENEVHHDERGEHDDPPGCIHITRALPIECKACRVMLDSYPALVSHCKQWSHRQNMDETHDQRVPEEFVDPRCMPSYEQLSVFGKAMALKTFEHKFIAFLHAPLDQDDIDNFTDIQQNILECMEDDSDIDNAEDLMSTITLQKVWEAFIEFVLIDFYEHGIDRYSLDVILAGGWHSFDIYSRLGQRIFFRSLGTHFQLR